MGNRSLKGSKTKSRKSAKSSGEATYTIRPLKWRKGFTEYGQRYYAETGWGMFSVWRFIDDETGKFGPWRIRADFDDRGDSFYETVKSASDGRIRCDEIYRQRVETMLVRVECDE